MPGPAIYVAAAIGTVAVVIVLKEFVFDPHVRPKISAWRENVSRRRRRARPQAHSVSSSSPFPSEADNERRSSSQRGTQGKKKQSKRSVGTSDTPHIDLQDLISSELIKSGIEADGDKTGIRYRRSGDSQKPGDHPVGNSASNSDSNSTQPLIPLVDLNVSDEAPSMRPENRLSERVVASSPLPSAGMHASTSIQAVQQDDTPRSGGTPHPLDVRGSVDSQTPVLVEIPHGPEISPITELGDFLTPIQTASGDRENTRLSSMDTDLFSLSDTLASDQYLTPHDQTLSPHRIHGTVSPALSSSLSIEFLSSPSFSPPGSPFIDAGLYRELIESRGVASPQRGEVSNGSLRASSPGVAEGTAPGVTTLSALRGDSEIFSVLSQASSDMSSDEGDYDSASILESELSNWTSDAADGEGAAQH